MDLTVHEITNNSGIITKYIYNKFVSHVSKVFDSLCYFCYVVRKTKQNTKKSDSKFIKWIYKPFNKVYMQHSEYGDAIWTVKVNITATQVCLHSLFFVSIVTLLEYFSNKIPIINCPSSQLYKPWYNLPAVKWYLLVKLWLSYWSEHGECNLQILYNGLPCSNRQPRGQWEFHSNCVYNQLLTAIILVGHVLLTETDLISQVSFTV